MPYLRYPFGLPFSELLKLLENALSEHPEDEVKLLRLLVIYSTHVSDKWDKALMWSDRLLQVAVEHEDRAEALRGRATVLWESRRNVEEAERLFIELHALDPEYQDSYENLVAIYLEQKEYDKALHWAETMSLQESMDYLGFHLKGEVLLEMERLEEAKAAFEEAIRMDVYPASSYEGLGMCHLAEENWELAKDAFIQAHERCGQHEALYPYGVGYCYQNMDNPYLAMKWYMKVLDIDPAYPNALNNLAVLELELENGWEEALPYLLKAVELSGEAINNEMRVVYRNLWAYYTRTLNYDMAAYYQRLNFRCLGFDDDMIDFFDSFDSFEDE